MRASAVNPSLERKLENIVERSQEVSALLSEPEVINDGKRFRDLSVEYSQLNPVVQCFADLQRARDDEQSAEEMLKDPDPELRDMAAEELEQARSRREALELELQKHLLPKDPNDNRNAFLEVRAGTGGDEAAIFAGDLFRMYSRFAETRGWNVEILSSSEGEHGGYKEIIARISGQDVYAMLKFESGAHRVQRVPETESQGRIHTSAATVAVIAEAGRAAGDRDQPGGSEGGHLPRLGRRRPARQQDRFGDTPHPPADRHRGRMPGRAFAAQEPGPRHVPAGGPAAGRGGRKTPRRGNRNAAQPGWQRGPFRTHSHLQFSAGPGD